MIPAHLPASLLVACDLLCLQTPSHWLPRAGLLFWGPCMCTCSVSRCLAWRLSLLEKEQARQFEGTSCELPEEGSEGSLCSHSHGFCPSFAAFPSLGFFWLPRPQFSWLHSLAVSLCWLTSLVGGMKSWSTDPVQFSWCLTL